MSRPTPQSSRLGRRLRTGAALAAIALLLAACGGTSATPSGDTGSPAPASAATNAPGGQPVTPTSTTLPADAGPTTPAVPAPSPSARPEPYVSATGLVGRWVTLGRSSGGIDVDRLVTLADGRILVVGGIERSESRAVILDPVARTWTPSSVQLDPGDAVVVRPGRVYAAGASGATVWLGDRGGGYDNLARHGLAPSAAALEDGRILVAGGCSPRNRVSGRGADDLPVGGDAIRSAEIRELDPSSDRDVATPIDDLGRARVGAPAATLADGRVLIAGSVTSYRFWFSDAVGDAVCAPDPTGDAEWTAEAWDPATARFLPAGAIPEPDRAAVAALGIEAPDGRPRVDDAGRLVPLLDGGALLLDRRESWSVGTLDPPRSWPVETQVTRSLRYDAATDAWHEIGASSVRQSPGDQRGSERFDGAVARLADGRVLVAGGGPQYGYGAIRWADLYDPVAGQWLPVAPLPEALRPAAAVALSDGSAIVIGVTGDELVAYRFVPTSPPDGGSGQPSAEPGLPTGACPETVTPSSLASMKSGLRVACFGSRDLAFDADVMIAEGTIVDTVPFDIPAIFMPVRHSTPDGDPDATWPVVLVDPGTQVSSPETWLPLVVYGDVIPWEIYETSRTRVRVTGHFDDAAAPACLMPRAGWPELTDEQAVLVCRSTLVVTRIELLD